MGKKIELYVREVGFYGGLVVESLEHALEAGASGVVRGGLAGGGERCPPHGLNAKTRDSAS